MVCMGDRSQDKASMLNMCMAHFSLAQVSRTSVEAIVGGAQPKGMIAMTNNTTKEVMQGYSFAAFCILVEAMLRNRLFYDSWSF